MSLQRRRERYIVLHNMWNIIISKTSNDLNIEFVFRPRLGNLAKIQVCKKSSLAFHWTAYERSFAVMGPRLWNCIPYNLNSIQNMDLFKMQLTGLVSVPDTRHFEATLQQTRTPYSAGAKAKEHQLRGVSNKTALLKINETQHR